MTAQYADNEKILFEGKKFSEIYKAVCQFLPEKIVIDSRINVDYQNWSARVPVLLKLCDELEEKLEKKYLNYEESLLPVIYWTICQIIHSLSFYVDVININEINVEMAKEKFRKTCRKSTGSSLSVFMMSDMEYSQHNLYLTSVPLILRVKQLFLVRYI